MNPERTRSTLRVLGVLLLAVGVLAGVGASTSAEHAVADTGSADGSAVFDSGLHTSGPPVIPPCSPPTFEPCSGCGGGGGGGGGGC